MLGKITLMLLLFAHLEQLCGGAGRNPIARLIQRNGYALRYAGLTRTEAMQDPNMVTIPLHSPMEKDAGRLMTAHLNRQFGKLEFRIAPTEDCLGFFYQVAGSSHPNS